MRIISNPPTEENPDSIPGIMDIRQQQVNDIKTDIENIMAEQETFQKEWNFQNCLENAGKDFYKIFCSYRREDTYTNSNYISDGLSTSECLAKAKELVEAATAEAKKACVLQRTISTSLNNLFALPEFESLYEKFALFNYIRIRTEDEILKLRLIGVEFSGDTVESIHVTFSEQIESIDGKLSDLQSIVQQTQSMATSFPSTALQAEKGEQAQNTVLDMYTSGLNAAKTMLTNNDNNEVTISQSGIICKRMDDEGSYGEKQLRITGNMMAFTKNNWKSVEMAIGETTFKDPTKPEGKNEVKAYGVIADAIVGKLVASERMYIGNESGNVLITGDGIDITNGFLNISNGKNTICIDPKNEGKLFAIKNGETDCLYTDNQGNINLTGKITGSSFVGGNLYIANGDYSVEIDPNHTNDATKDGYLFCIRDKNKSANDVIMGVTKDGNGYFSGEINAASWSSKNFNVNENGHAEAEDLRITGGEIHIITSENYIQAGIELTDNFELHLNHKGILYKKQSEITSYSISLRPNGLFIDNEPIIDSPGQGIPSIKNIYDVITFDGISLRSELDKINSNINLLNLKTDETDIILNSSINSINSKFSSLENNLENLRQEVNKLQDKINSII